MRQGSARKHAGGSTATTRRAPVVLQKGVTLHKKLDSPDVAPYHTPIHCGARSLGAAGATEGPARQLWQAILAGPPSTRRILMVCLIIMYFPHPVSIFFVRVRAASCFPRPWILSLKVRSLRRAFRKETNSHACWRAQDWPEAGAALTRAHSPAR